MDFRFSLDSLPVLTSSLSRLHLALKHAIKVSKIYVYYIYEMTSCLSDINGTPASFISRNSY